VTLGIGIDYAIQMQARVDEEIIVDRAHAPLQETARGLCPALVVVTLDAVFAFTALRFAKVPMIREFGLLLSVGIAVICLASIVIPLAVLGIRERKSPTTGRSFGSDRLGRLTKWLGSLPLWAGPILAAVSFVVFFGGVAVEDRLELQSDPVQWVDQSSASIKDFRAVEEQTGSSSELAFFVQTAPDQVFSQDTVDFISGYAYGLLEERKATVNQIRDTVSPPEGIKAVPSGLAIVGVGLLENLQANRILLTYLALLFVGMNVAVALLVALTVLPPLLVWADTRGWVSKGEIPPDLLATITPGLAGMTEAEAVAQGLAPGLDPPQEAAARGSARE